MDTNHPSDVVCDGDVCRRITIEEAATHHNAAPTTATATRDALHNLLGDTLLSQEGQAMPLTQVTGPGKVIGLYFSAHWCPPCRMFTPLLGGIYTRFKADHAHKADFEIVFVSSDRDEESFNKYFHEQPWLALPYAQRELKAALSKKFKVKGIPSLVILDGSTGEVINSNARDAVAADELCEDFPWRPKTATQLLHGDLVDKSGKVVAASEALAGKVQLLYFSAHWCPPCRRFTPMLVEAYGKLKAAGHAVEVVFVSGDRNPEQYQEYLGEMPWLALPYEARERGAQLNALFEVEGIPTLVVLDEHGKVITTDGQGAVVADPDGADFPWHPKPLDKLSSMTVSAVNDVAVLLVVLDDSEAAAGERAMALLQHTAVAFKAGPLGDQVTLLWSHLRDELAQKVLGFAGVSEATQGGDQLVLLDVPSQVVYKSGLVGAEITAESAAKFLHDFTAGQLMGRPLGGGDE